MTHDTALSNFRKEIRYLHVCYCFTESMIVYFLIIISLLTESAAFRAIRHLQIQGGKFDIKNEESRYIRLRRFAIKVDEEEGTFTSESAKKQIGNDSFLNKDLMARAQNGPGVKNQEKLNIGIVGTSLT